DSYIQFERAKVSLLKGDHADALEHFFRALILFQRFEVRDHFTAATIEGIAKVAMENGQASEAVVLFASTSAWRLTTQAPVSFIDGRAIQLELETARKRMGQEAFDAQWVVGGTMSIDDAIAVSYSVAVKPAAESRAAEMGLPADLRRLSPRERQVLCLIAL